MMRTNRKPFHAAVLNRSNLRAFKRRKNFAASFRKSPSPSSRRFFVSIGCGASSPSNVCQAARNNRLIGLSVGGPRWVPAAARPVAEVLSFALSTSRVVVRAPVFEIAPELVGKPPRQIVRDQRCFAVIGGHADVLEDVGAQEEIHIILERVEIRPKPRRAAERREAFRKIYRRA